MLIDELPTPCVLIDRQRLLRNVRDMQKKADENGVRLRPHTKTHKSVQLASIQIDEGAAGLTVAKPSEAEVFVDAGFDDIRLAYSTVGEDKWHRVLKLMDRARISFCVDTPEGAQAASDFFQSHNAKAEVLVEVDPGYGRCGVPWNRHTSEDFVAFVRDLPGLSLSGILTHAGHSYKPPEHEAESISDAIRRVAIEESGHMLSFASRLKKKGIVGPENFEISIGSTPSIRHFENSTRDGFTITEIRPGNYVFHDAVQQALSVASWDQCSMTVLTTVTSKHRTGKGVDKLFLDAGKKVFTSDTGYGTSGYGVMLYNPSRRQPLPHARITGLSEEHGWVQVSGGSTLAVGDRVQVVPNHACVVAAQQARLFVIENDTVVDTWNVDARGCLV